MSCNWFVGSWPPFITGLLYDDPPPSPSQQIVYKTLVAKQLPTCQMHAHTHTHMYTHAYTYTHMHTHDSYMYMHPVHPNVINWFVGSCPSFITGLLYDNPPHPSVASWQIAYKNFDCWATHTHTYIHTHVHTHIIIHTHGHTHVHTYMHVHTHTRTIL